MKPWVLFRYVIIHPSPLKKARPHTLAGYWHNDKDDKDDTYMAVEEPMYDVRTHYITGKKYHASATFDQT